VPRDHLKWLTELEPQPQTWQVQALCLFLKDFLEVPPKSGGPNIEPRLAQRCSVAYPPKAKAQAKRRNGQGERSGSLSAKNTRRLVRPTVADPMAANPSGGELTTPPVAEGTR